MPSGETPDARGQFSDGLEGFFGALHRLERGPSKVPVVISWFGDSHTAADFLTGELRRRLQARFGDGGPGFVPLGIPNTRHDSVVAERSGKWLRQPHQPTLFARQHDGVFGLAGIRARGQDGARASLRMFGTAPTGARWEVIARPVGAGATVTLQGDPGMGREFSFTSPDLAPDDTARVRGSQLLGLVLDNRPSKTLRIAARRMEIFGAIGESNEPGLVLDALGINGARIRTMLAWDEGTWLGELAERDPALVVLAYGTNEAGDGVAVDGYAEDYRNVLGRVRVGVPEADCLLVGPTDRGDDHPTAPRRAIAIDEMQREVAAELGCAYFSLVQAMGGPGGFARWAVRKPALASADGVHLTVDGYRELAKALSDQLVAAYEAPRIDTTAGRF